MGDIYSGNAFTFGIREEDTFLTAEGDADAYAQLVAEMAVINADKKLRNPNRANGLHGVTDVSDVYINTDISQPSLTIKSEAIKTELDYFLYALFQNVTEGASTPFSKVFTFPTAPIDLTAGDGISLTIIKKSLIASTSEKLTSAICKKLVLSLGSKDDGLLTMQAEMIARAYSRTSNPSGTWTKSAYSTFGFYAPPTFTINGNACVLKDYQLTLENGAALIGAAQNYAFPKLTADLEITVCWDANARLALTAFDASTEIPIVLTWGTPGADGHLDITIRGKLVPGTELAHSVTADVKLKFMGMGNSSTAAIPASITLANAVDRGW